MKHHNHYSQIGLRQVPAKQGAKYEAGYIVDYDEFFLSTEKSLGKGIKLDPRVLNLTVTGSRILVIRDEAPETTEGGIIVPESVRDYEQPGAGWVVGVGPMVGMGTGTYPHGWTGDHPTLLLGQHIMFRKYQGIELRLDMSQEGYAISYIWMTDRDILGIDFN